MTARPFPWSPGMADRRGWRVVAVHKDRAFVAAFAATMWVRVRDLADPDYEDSATLGALLGRVREAWGEPVIYIAAYAGDGGGWVIERVRDGETSWLSMSGTWDTRYPMVSDSEADALLAAWKAAP